MQSLTLVKQMRRPSTPRDSLFRQKSFTPRNSISTSAKEGPSPSCSNKERNFEKVCFAPQQPVLFSPEMKAESSASADTPGVEAMAPFAANDQLETSTLLDQQPHLETQKAWAPKKAITYKQRLTKNIVFLALSKHNGLKKLSQRASKLRRTEMESVFVQRATSPDVEKEPQEEAKDSQPALPIPVLPIRKVSDVPSEAAVRSEVKKTNAVAREMVASKLGSPGDSSGGYEEYVAFKSTRDSRAVERLRER